ncbi:MAG: metallophosphatase domain-containing protein [Myxococcota bacterium]
MRIVAVADTHTFQDDLGSLPEGDVFIHAGDLLRGGTLEELAPVAEWIRALPHRRKIVVAGNHDWCFANDPAAACATLGPEVEYLEDSGTMIDGLQFWGSPWQPEYHDWAYNLPRGAALREKWAQIRSDTDVLITHGPPQGIGDRGPVPGRLGCADLAARVAEVGPLLHLFGHIHQDGGVFRVGDVCYANVTTWESERRPTVLDVVDGAVIEVDVPPRETRPLASTGVAQGQ